MDPHLYSLAVRAILNEECQSSPSPEQNHNLSKKRQKACNPAKAASTTRKCAFELAEKLRQLLGADIDEEQHQSALEQATNCVEHVLSIGVESEHAEVAFVLQIVHSDGQQRGGGREQEEQFRLNANAAPVEITLPHGRSSLLRLFSAAPNPHRQSSNASPSAATTPCASTTSSSSSPSIGSNESARLIPQATAPMRKTTACSSAVTGTLASKSSSFLKRWTRVHIRRCPLMSVRVRNLPPNECHQMTIPGTLPPATLKCSLKKRMAGEPPHVFQPMEMFEFIALLRSLRDTFLGRWSAKEEHQEWSREEEGDQDGQLDEMAKAFRHFSEMSESAESVRHTLDEVRRRVARFNDFSPLAELLLEIGVALEHCQFWPGGEERLAEKRADFAWAAVQQHLARLKGERIGTEQQLKAAVFLAEHIVHVFTAITAQSECRHLFFPPALFCQQKGELTFGRRLLVHSAEFEQFSEHTLPLLELVQLALWEHPGVSGLPSTVSRLFQHSLQHRLAEFVRAELPPQQANLDSLGDLVDSLRLFLAPTQCRPIEVYFERVWLGYSARVLHALDDPLCVAAKSVLDASIARLRFRDTDELVAFTKASMRLFDAFMELNDLSKQFGENCAFQQFEPWFERAAVFWSSTWRTVYMEFIRKCVQESPAHSPAKPSAGPQVPSSLSALPQLSSPDPPPFHQNQRRPSLDPFCHSPSSPAVSVSPPRGSRIFVLADFRKQDSAQQLHEGTVNMLAFCKALCDDFLRLRARHRAIVLLGTLQVSAILVDCLGCFATQLLQRLKQAPPTYSNMVRTANGIEHASAYLAQNVERFLNIRQLDEVAHMDEAERVRTVDSVRHMIGSARNRCRAITDQIVESLCEARTLRMRRYCSLITRNWHTDTEQRKKPLQHYLHQFRQMLPSNSGEPADQLLLFLDKLCAHLQRALLPRLFSAVRLALWKNVQRILERQLRKGEPLDYYHDVERACKSICHILQLDWAEEHNSLRRVLHANKTATRDLVLQYYGHLADLTMGTERPSAPVPRILVRAAYLRTAERQILLQIHVLAAFNVPILDRFTQSSDPYVRLELQPHCLFPLAQYPAQTTDTKKQTLSPKWNQVFQIALPEELFFTNGACLCLTVLDHDVMSYNDLAGQAFLLLGPLPRVTDTSSARSLPAPLVLPLRMPSFAQYQIEPFQILEQRSARDEMAREMTGYEKYIRDYHILPPCAQDDKEWTVRSGLPQLASRGKEQLRRFANGLMG